MPYRAIASENVRLDAYSQEAIHPLSHIYGNEGMVTIKYWQNSPSSTLHLSQHAEQRPCLQRATLRSFPSPLPLPPPAVDIISSYSTLVQSTNRNWSSYVWDSANGNEDRLDGKIRWL